MHGVFVMEAHHGDALEDTRQAYLLRRERYDEQVVRDAEMGGRRMMGKA